MTQRAIKIFEVSALGSYDPVMNQQFFPYKWQAEREVREFEKEQIHAEIIEHVICMNKEDLCNALNTLPVR